VIVSTLMLRVKAAELYSVHLTEQRGIT